MPHIDEIETKILDMKTAMDYKHHLLKLMVDMENSQDEFIPLSLRCKKMTEKLFIKENGIIDNVIKEIYDNNSFIIGSFHVTKNNTLIAYLVLNIWEYLGEYRSGIRSIYVDPYYRGIHISKILINMAIEELKSYTNKPSAIQLGVLTENKIPLKIYNELGFKLYHQEMYLKL